MAIRDFNVFEMQRRNTAPTKGALAQKPGSVVTKRMGPRQDESAKGQQSSKLAKKGTKLKGRKLSRHTRSNADLNLPKTIEVEEIGPVSGLR